MKNKCQDNKKNKMKELKDYLHLYLGCETVWEDGSKEILTAYWLHKIQGSNWWDLVKPILRPISDMTEDEMKECGNLDYDLSDDPYLDKKWEHVYFEFLLSNNQFVWLLSKHFDLFGLIESGLAIDKSTVQK